MYLEEVGGSASRGENENYAGGDGGDGSVVLGHIVNGQFIKD